MTILKPKNFPEKSWKLLDGELLILVNICYIINNLTIQGTIIYILTSDSVLNSSRNDEKNDCACATVSYTVNGRHLESEAAWRTVHLSHIYVLN